MNLSFDTNKKPIEVLKEGAFRGFYFREICSGINSKWYKRSWKQFDKLKDVNKKCYCSNYYDISINKYKIKCGLSFRFWENEDWVISKDPYGWFQWYFRYWLGRRSLGDERQIARWEGIVSRFKGKLIKMIKDVNGNLIIILIHL